MNKQTKNNCVFHVMTLDVVIFKATAPLSTKLMSLEPNSDMILDMALTTIETYAQPMSQEAVDFLQYV